MKARLCAFRSLCQEPAHYDVLYSLALTFSNISAFVLSSPIVGYITGEEFHVISWSVNSKVKLDKMMARTISGTR